MNLFTPAETVANYAAIGAAKARQPLGKLLVLSILAGMLIGFPVCVTNMACYAMPTGSLIRIVAGVLFAFGLGTVVLSGAELLTGNTLIIISVLDRRAGEHQPAHHAAESLRVTLLYLRRFLEYIAHALVDKAGYAGAVVFAVDYPRKLPVVEAGEFADKVAEARDGHAVGRGAEYVRVADDDLRAVGGHGRL